MKYILSGILWTSMLLLSAFDQAVAQSGNNLLPKDYAVLINLSGKQRMLTQKMSKEVMLVALKIETEKNVANLEKTATLYDKTLKGFRYGDSDLGIKKTDSRRVLRQIGIVEKAWESFYPAIRQIVERKGVTREEVDFIASNNLPLLGKSNKLVRQYERLAARSGLGGSSSAVEINLAGKQRMLTQKMSKEYLLLAFGHQPEANRLNLYETTFLFDQTLKGLVEGDSILALPGTQSPRIRTQLKKVSGQWQDIKGVFVDGAVNIESINNDRLSKVASLNLPLLVEMNKAVKLFELEAAG